MTRPGGAPKAPVPSCRIGIRVALLAPWVALACVAPDRADSPVEGIVYTTLRPRNLDIYLFPSADGPARRVTDHPALDYNPTFSPDGRWLVFTSERDGSPDLWALDLEDDDEPIPLTRGAALDDAADFSPDGRALVFVSTRDGDADIFLMPFDPGDPTAEGRAENLTRREGGDFNPAFSPDGRWIAFTRQDKLWPDPHGEAFDANGVDLYVMEADGSGVRELIGQVAGPELEPGLSFGSVAGSPAWSSDGERIYYYRVDAGGREIRQVRADGSDDVGLGWDGLSPAVGPHGEVVFSRPRTDRGLDALDILKTGRIVLVESGSRVEQAVGDSLGEYFAPDLGPSGRIAVHGRGSTEGHVGALEDGFLFSPPGARGRARMADRDIPVWGIRGYFPALTPDGDVVSTVPEETGPTLSRAPVDGARRVAIFEPEGLAWGPSIARQAGVMVVAVGMWFASGSDGVDIWRVPLDGTDPVNLTSGVSANDALPHISPDGRRIVFRTGGDGSGSVMWMEGDGRGRRGLTDGEAVETMPALSSDGAWVVFSTDRAGGRKLWLQRLDGSEGRFLEPDRLGIPDTSMHPRFSPDDQWVVFTSDRGGFNDEWPLTPVPQPYGDLWAVSVADGSTVRLMHNKWEDGPSDWGPVRIPAGAADRR